MWSCSLCENYSLLAQRCNLSMRLLGYQFAKRLKDNAYYMRVIAALAPPPPSWASKADQIISCTVSFLAR